jgi:Ca2+-binding EF-hand superfamily protein
MIKLQSLFIAAALLSSGLGLGLAAEPSDFARGNMHFDVAEMDANHDGMVSKDEYMHYGETTWGRMAQGGKDTVSVEEASKDFATGNMRFNAKAMDADHDGTISKDEFMKYGEAMWDRMKKDDSGMMSVDDAAKDFSRGNMHSSH